MANKKKLCKSSKDVKICGVCGGLAEYFNISSIWIRVIWAVVSFYYGIGILIYILCAFIFPEDNGEQ